MQKYLIIIASWFVTGCQHQYTVFPEIDETTAKSVVAVGYFRRGSYLPEDAMCSFVYEGDEIIVCGDPPPMALHFRVSSTLAGPEAPHQLVTFTTSHWGKDIINFGSKHPYLLHLLTNGDEFVTPRYEMTALAIDTRGNWAIPMESRTNTPTWLPCKAPQFVVSEIEFTGPRSVISFDFEDLTDSEQDELEEYWRMSDNVGTMYRGVYMDDLERELEECTPDEE